MRALPSAIFVLCLGMSLTDSAGNVRAQSTPAAVPPKFKAVDVNERIVYPEVPEKERTEVVWVRRIWDRTRSGRPYHSWMSVNFFKGNCFLSVSESLAASHRDKQQIHARLIASKDACRTWESVLSYGDEKKGSGSTLAFIVPTPDGKLHVENTIKDYATQKVQQRVIVSEDGFHWSKPKHLTGLKQYPFGSYFMELAWHKDTVYGFQYMTGLVRSRNGFDFETWPTVNMNQALEVGIGFLPTGDMVLFGFNGLISVSRPPYRHWVTNTTNIVSVGRGGGVLDYFQHFFCGPRLCVTPDGEVYASARTYGHRRQWQYTLWRLEGRQLELMQTFPGSYYYMDVVWHDGFLWVVYSGTPRRAEQAKLGRTAVYLAKVRLPEVKKPLTARPFPYFFTPPKTEPPRPQLIGVRRIADAAPHSGQTDLVRFRGRWVCACREADHRPWLYVGDKNTATGGRGKIRMLLSEDAVAWKEGPLLAETGTDLVTPQLSVTPDGRLMLIVGAYRYGSPKKTDARLDRLVVSDRSLVAFSKAPETWTRFRPVGGPGLPEEVRLARAAWHEGKAYALTRSRQCDKRRASLLLSSANGVDYAVVNEPRQRRAMPGSSEGRRLIGTYLVRSFAGNESALRFDREGAMVVLAGTTGIGLSKRVPPRRTDWMAEIASSRPPYMHWDVRNVNSQPLRRCLRSPNFVILPNGDRWAVLRDGAERKTVLYRMGRDTLEPALELPSAGTDRHGADQGHPGMVWHDGFLWVTYHSGHESRKTGKQASVYLAKIRLPVKP